MSESGHDMDAAAHLEHAQSTFTINVDTTIISLGVAAIMVGLAYRMSKNLEKGVPGRWQNLLESLVDFINQTVSDNFKHENKLLAPLALTIFAYVFCCNLLGELPLNLGLKPPPADLNMPLALALCVFFIVHYYSVKQKGLRGYINEYLFHPFGKWLMPVNIMMKLIEEIAKPVSLSFRLFGNIFAGEVIFILISMLIPWWLNWLPGVPWITFHLLIAAIQAFVFMILTIVYVSMAFETEADH